MARRCRKKGGQRKATFREIFRSSRGRANRNLFLKARTASRLAKLVGGKRRRQLYGIKDRCLEQLITVGGVPVFADHVLCWGLLSVGVAGLGRLHTHEAWLAQSRGPEVVFEQTGDEQVLRRAG